MTYVKGEWHCVRFFFISKTSEGFYMTFSTKKWLDEVVTLVKFSVTLCYDSAPYFAGRLFKYTVEFAYEVMNIMNFTNECRYDRVV
jgi:hypothetical protein